MYKVYITSSKVTSCVMQISLLLENVTSNLTSWQDGMQTKNRSHKAAMFCLTFAWPINAIGRCTYSIRVMKGRQRTERRRAFVIRFINVVRHHWGCRAHSRNTTVKEYAARDIPQRDSSLFKLSLTYFNIVQDM